MKFAGPESFRVIRMARLYEKGLPAVAGGQLDQAAMFVEACEFIWTDQAEWKAEKKADKDNERD